MSYAEAEELLITTSTYAISKTYTEPMGHYDISPVPKVLREKLQRFRMGEGHGNWQERLERL
jgi:hypothetical protein